MPMLGRLPRLAAMAPLAGLAAVAVAAVVVVVARGDGAGSAGADVAATVNGEAILRSEVREAASRSPERDEEKALDRLVDAAVLAHAARMEQLERDPEVRRRILDARRQVLASAYLERLAQSGEPPEPSEVRRFFDGNPLLFSKRRIYTYRELRLPVPAPDLDRLRNGIEAAANPAEVDRVLAKLRASATERQVNEPAERIPLSLLAPLALLSPGRSLVQVESPSASGEGGERMRVVTLVATEPAPMAYQNAQASIVAFLRAQQRGDAVSSGLAELRAKARIERFAPESRAASAADGTTLLR